MKTDLKFVFDIIDSKIDGYRLEEQSEGYLTEGMYQFEISALEDLKRTLKEFIKDANKL